MNNKAVFQSILSSRGSCRPSEWSPRPRANFFSIICNSMLICHLSGQEASFVRSPKMYKIQIPGSRQCPPDPQQWHKSPS